jgi:hypothetical protein
MRFMLVIATLSLLLGSVQMQTLNTRSLLTQAVQLGWHRLTAFRDAVQLGRRLREGEVLHHRGHLVLPHGLQGQPAEGAVPRVVLLLCRLHVRQAWQASQASQGTGCLNSGMTRTVCRLKDCRVLEKGIEYAYNGWS